MGGRGKGYAPRLTCNRPRLQTFRPSTGHLAGPLRSTHSQVATEDRRSVGLGEGSETLPKARLQFGSRKARKWSFPPAAVQAGAQVPPTQPGPDSSTRLGGWRRRKPRQVLLLAAEPGAAALPPPRRGSRGPSRGQTRCDWPAAAGRGGGGGASQAGISWTASKEPRILQSALEPWPARSLPRRRRAGSWEFRLALTPSLLQTTGSYMPLCPPTSTPCPHAPAPATGKGCCVFSYPLLSRCLCPGEWTRAAVPDSALPGCSRGAQLSRCCSAHPRSRVPAHAYRVCVRTSTSPELKILRHAWNS